MNITPHKSLLGLTTAMTNFRMIASDLADTETVIARMQAVTN